MRHADLKDEALLVLLRSDSAVERDAAYNELDARYRRYLYVGLRRLVGHEDAEDLVEETFIRLLQRADQFDPEHVSIRGGRTTVKAWLWGIAYHLALDHLRRRFPAQWPAAAGGEQLAIPFADTIAGNEPDPVDVVVDREERAAQLNALADCLQRLQERHPAWWQVLALHREGYAYLQIAEMLGRPVGTVQGQSGRIHQFLRDCLEKKGITL